MTAERTDFGAFRGGAHGGQRAGHPAQRVDLGTALVARGQMDLEVMLLGGVEGPERVGGGLVAARLVHQAIASGTERAPRSLPRPSRIRPLTVPMGAPMTSAISECE